MADVARGTTVNGMFAASRVQATPAGGFLDDPATIEARRACLRPMLRTLQVQQEGLAAALRVISVRVRRCRPGRPLRWCFTGLELDNQVGGMAVRAMLLHLIVGALS